MATPAARRHGLANKHFQRQCPANRHDRARPKPPHVASPMRLHIGRMICEQRGCTYMPCHMMRDQQGCTRMPHDSTLRAQRYVTNQVARNLPRPWRELGSGTQLSRRPTATLATPLPRHAAMRLRTWPTDALANKCTQHAITTHGPLLTHPTQLGVARQGLESSVAYCYVTNTVARTSHIAEDGRVQRTLQ